MSKPAFSRPQAIAILHFLGVMFGANHIAARIAFDHGVGLSVAVLVRSGVTALVLLGLGRQSAGRAGAGLHGHYLDWLGVCARCARPLGGRGHRRTRCQHRAHSRAGHGLADFEPSAQSLPNSRGFDCDGRYCFAGFAAQALGATKKSDKT